MSVWWLAKYFVEIKNSGHSLFSCVQGNSTWFKNIHLPSQLAVTVPLLWKRWVNKQWYDTSTLAKLQSLCNGNLSWFTSEASNLISIVKWKQNVTKGKLSVCGLYYLLHNNALWSPKVHNAEIWIYQLKTEILSLICTVPHNILHI